MLTIAAAFAILVLTGLTLFQLALIFGAPIARFAWGGQHDRLPSRLRAASAVSIVLYLTFMAFIASKAQIASLIPDQTILNTGMWLFTAYFFVGIFMNAISRSKPERYTMTPVAAMLAMAFLTASIA